MDLEYEFTRCTEENVALRAEVDNCKAIKENIVRIDRENAALRARVAVLDADIALRNHYGACERCAVGPCSEGAVLRAALAAAKEGK